MIHTSLQDLRVYLAVLSAAVAGTRAALQTYITLNDRYGYSCIKCCLRKTIETRLVHLIYPLFFYLTIVRQPNSQNLQKLDAAVLTVYPYYYTITK